MGLAPDALVFDCAKTLPVGSFWAGALGFSLDHDPDDPNDDGVLLIDPSKLTRGIYFQSVPEPKEVDAARQLRRIDEQHAVIVRIVRVMVEAEPQRTSPEAPNGERRRTIEHESIGRQAHLGPRF